MNVRECEWNKDSNTKSERPIKAAKEKRSSQVCIFHTIL